jgi:hypothetical protein
MCPEYFLLSVCCCLLSRMQGKIMTEIANRSLENVTQFKYLEKTVINQNLIQEEINRRMNSGSACYHSVQNLLSSRLQTKKREN